MAVPARQLDRENAALRELVTVYRHLSGLALQDADLAGVVRLISDRTAATVAVLTQLIDVLTAAAPGVTAAKAAADVREYLVHPRLGQVLRASRLSQRALRLPKVGGMPAVIVAPIQVGDEVPSYLVTADPAENLFGEDMSLLVTEHAATICGVILGRERVVAAASRRVRDDLVEGLLLGRGRDNADASRWAAHLGYDPARDHNVLAIAFELPPSAVPGHEDDAAPGERIRESIEHFVATRAPEAIVSARECEVVVVTAAPIDARHLAAACLARLAELFPAAKAVVGIGGTCRDPRDVARSYAQAERTTQTLLRLGRSGVVAAFGDLGILRLLLQVPDLAELRSFAADVLGKLSLHEHEHRSAYLTTLACYFRENSSPQRASRLLHVHPNTVAYRVKRIEEITGLRLDNYTDRLIAQVAVDGIWEVDSLGLIALLAGLNAGRDSNGLALTTRTSFCVGARVNPGARDAGAEIARARATVSVGAHFLVSRPVYDIDSLLRLVTALAVPEVPLLLSVAPLRSFEEADYLANEVPGVCIPADTLRAMERAGRGAARAVGIELAADLLLAARKLVSGVIVTAVEDDPAGLSPLLAAAPPVTSPVRRLSWTAAARRRFPARALRPQTKRG